MSTVTPSTTPIVPIIDTSSINTVTTPVGTTNTGSTGSVTPNTATLPSSVKLNPGFQGISFDTLGIRMPSSPEDTAAILAEVAQLLDQTMDEARNKRSEQIANALRGLLGDAGGLSEGIATHREEYNRLQVERDAKIGERDGKVAQRDALVAQRDSKVAERDALSGQAGAYAAQIAALNVLIAQGGNTAPLIATRDALQVQLNTVNGRIGVLNGEIGQLNGQIQQLNTEIAQLNSEIAVLQGKMDTEKAAYEALELLRDILMNVFAQFALTIAGREGLGAVEDFNWNEDIERLFDNLADALKQFQLVPQEQVADVDMPDVPLPTPVKTAADAAIDRRLAAEALALATAVAQVVAALSSLDSLPANAKGGAEDGVRLRLAV